MTEKLSDTGRETTLNPLLDAGWSMTRRAMRSARLTNLPILSKRSVL